MNYILLLSTLLISCFSLENKTLIEINREPMITIRDNSEIEIFEEPIIESVIKKTIYGSIFSGYWSNRNKFYYY